MYSVDHQLLLHKDKTKNNILIFHSDTSPLFCLWPPGQYSVISAVLKNVTLAID